MVACSDLFVSAARVHLTRASHDLQLRRIARVLAAFTAAPTRSASAVPTPAR